MTQSKPLILVDGSSYLFRAYYALPALTNSKGHPTGAIYGVLNMLKRLKTEYDPEYVAVIFDPKGKTFRHELYPEYKANRTVMPEELSVQIQPLHELIKALGFPLIIEPGVEADDVIGTLTRRAEEKGMSVLISTGDKDMTQLVNEHVTLVNTMTNEVLNPAGVLEKFGVSPERIIDYLTLIGDTSDNIPGVPKVGPKTAVKWLQQYGSLDEIIRRSNEIEGKVGENLRNTLNDLPLSKKLVTIQCDVPIPEKIEELKLSSPNHDALAERFRELEFKAWVTEITSSSKAAAPVTYETLLTKEDFAQWIKRLKAARQFSFDTETTSLEPMQAELVGLSFAVEKGEAAYIPLAHDYEGAPQQLSRDWVLRELQPLLSDSSVTIIGQNLKYDFEVLANYGITVSAKIVDTMLESYVINSTATRHDLDSLSLNYLNHQNITFEELAGKGVKQLTFNQIAIDKASTYAAEDADVTWQLHQKFIKTIDENPEYRRIFYDIEMPLMPILMKMELHGVLIDVDLLKKQSHQLEKRLYELEQEAYGLAGKEFNLQSPKQLQTIFFEELKIPVLKKTPGGQASTAENVLQDLALHYPLPKVILEHRSLSKLKSTYTDRLPEQINPKTGRVHTSYNQAVTSTGRLSSNNPNLQNIPIRTEEGRKIREAFIAPPNCKIISADYSQVELRIVAHLSQDPGLLKAFEQGLDVHRATAAEMFGIPFDTVTDEQRRRAKAINFGLLYGMSAFGLSKQLGIDRSEADRHIKEYFGHYPKVHAYMEHSREIAAKQGYVETLFGRRLHIPDIQSTDRQRRMGAERAAINAPMQGTAADIIKRAMIEVDHWLSESQIEAVMIMQVHDELIFEVHEKDIDEAAKQIKRCMEGAASLSVPLTVDLSIGKTWGDAH